ncbi:MAG: TRCF domain-containing protein, partial [Alphaproteobacteria bacterium]
QAFAYITYPKGMKLSNISEQRLSIIQSIDSLGGGFTVATHDMDLRGHGNILGDEQSGHVKEVGIELYQQMLEEAISALRSNDDGNNEDKEWSPIINLGITVQIPEEYIPDLSLRVNLYRRIANSDEIPDLTAEIGDRFGPIPESVMNLIAVVQIKHNAKKANIEKLDLSEDSIIISFKDGKAADPDKVIDFINKNFMHSKFKGGKKLIVSLKCLNGSDIFSKVQCLIDAICVI